MLPPEQNKLPLEIAYEDVSACSDAIIIDCRTEEEFERSHLDHSINIPLQHLILKVDNLPCKQDDSIFVYCKSGNRSTTFATYLRSIGFAKCQTILGGYTSWGKS